MDKGTEIAITAIIATLGAIIATIIAKLLWKKYVDDNITIKRIINSNDKDIKRLIELYLQLFSDESTNYSGQDIITMIEQQNHDPKLKHIKADDFLLIAKWKGDVVGFLFCHYYKTRKKAIVSYYGIDKANIQARVSGTNELLKTLRSCLNNGKNDCDYLFFDVEDESAVRTKAEKRERRARKIVLKQTTKEFGLTAYELKFNYRTPKINVTDETKETKLSLMVIPLLSPIENPLPHSIVGEFLDFIYLDCYGDLYEITDFRYENYRKHLLEKLDKLKKGVPEKVPLE